MITTLRMIAEASGYSTTAVSMVMSGRGAGHIATTTRQKIINAAMSLGYQHNQPLKLPNLAETEKAWLAGIVDGEGCITITRSYPTVSTTHRTIAYKPHIVVSMGHKPTVDRIADLFQIGSSSIEIMSKNPAWNDTYKWQASSRMAITCVSLIRPYLVTKAEEADVLLEYGTLPNIRTGRAGLPPELLAKREALFERMRDLKPRNQTLFARLSKRDY